MNGRTIFYWIVTALMAAFMIMSAIPDLNRSEVAVTAFTHLGYPIYLLPFIGSAKIAGVAAVLLPSPRRVKEWAYAGLIFDLTGALYSHLSVGDPAGVWMFAVIGLILVTGSYLLGGIRRAPALQASGAASGWE
jgi:hypothetical protein